MPHFSQLLHRRDNSGEVLGVCSLDFMTLSGREGTAASTAFKYVFRMSPFTDFPPWPAARLAIIVGTRAAPALRIPNVDLSKTYPLESQL
jgi:hypothetical protein